MDTDIAVIGSGPGGYTAALEAARWGASVALVEAREVGGVCLNRGCIPSKSLIKSGEVLESARRAAEFGLPSALAEAGAGVCALAGSPPPSAPSAGIQARKDAVVKRLRDGLTATLKAAKVRIVTGRARFASPAALDVEGGEPVRFRSAILATGTEPRALPGLAFTPGRILSSDELLALQALPARLAIVGGGVIGLEMAFFHRALGVEVVVVELLDALLPGFDPDVRAEAAKLCRKRGIALRLGAKILSASVRDDGVSLSIEGAASVEAGIAAVCVGRSANLPALGLDAAGVRADASRIPVDECLRTNVPSIFAIGDVTGQKPLAHVASYQGRIAAWNAAGKSPARKADLRAVPSVVYADPEFAAVGLAETEAQLAGAIVVGKTLVRSLGRGHTEGSIDGFFKWVAQAESLRILGAHAVAAHASEHIHEAVLAVRLGLTLRDIADTIHAHPTFSEGWLEAAEAGIRAAGG